MSKKHHFSGWVTKNDIKCSDGVTIKHDAFKGNDGQKVPLVWNHDYNTPENILGHVILHNHEQGVYGYGYFNDTEAAKQAKALVEHGDINAMSIGARKIKRSGTDVIHGSIYEVSLVLAAANPGATIDAVITHGDTDELSEAIIYTGNLIHSAEDILLPSDQGGKQMSKQVEKEEELQHAEKTIQDVIDTMTPEQQDAVYALVGMMAEELEEDEKGDDETMKQNVFQGKEADTNETLKHGINEILVAAVSGKASSLRDAFESQNDDTIKHGINSIEMLFPEAYNSTNGGTPLIFKDPNTQYEKILGATAKSPFSRIKTTVADLTEEEARAKGYIKGNMKKEEFFSLIRRVTTPTTVYKKQKLDRDDIIDITDFNVVAFMNAEMKMMLKEEIARAVLVGDGRDVDSDDKINETNIRPVITDHDFFTIKKAYAAADKFIEAVLLAMKEYRGSGMPTMYIDPAVLTAVKLLKGTDGRYLMGHIPSNSELCALLGLSEIVETSFMYGKGALIVNLRDYTLGATKGGEITNFDDFDIDFNQYKYLIETRLCGALTLPKSAIHLNPSTAGTGADDTQGGVTFGKRQADKTVDPDAGE